MKIELNKTYKVLDVFGMYEYSAELIGRGDYSFGSFFEHDLFVFSKTGGFQYSAAELKTKINNEGEVSFYFYSRYYASSIEELAPSCGPGVFQGNPKFKFKETI